MIVDWRLEVIYQCVSSMGIMLSNLEDKQSFTLQFEDGDCLHLDLDQQDCIRVSIRRELNTTEIDELLDRLLRFNFYKRYAALQPLAYLLEESLVVRLVLSQSQLRKNSMAESIETLRAAREHIMDARYV